MHSKVSELQRILGQVAKDDGDQVTADGRVLLYAALGVHPINAMA